MKKHKTLWAVMKAHRFDGVTANGHRITTQGHDPEYFVPVFRAKKDAIKWSGSEKHIVEVDFFPTVPT